MKKFLTIITATFFALHLSAGAQNKYNNVLYRDSVCVDSVVVLNKTLRTKMERFYERNVKQIDSNSYFLIEMIRYQKTKYPSMLLTIYLGCEMENDLQFPKPNQACYFRIHDKIALIPFMDDTIKLFERTGKKRVLQFNRKEKVVISTGVTRTQAGYLVYMPQQGIIKVRKKFYYKHVCSGY